LRSNVAAEKARIAEEELNNAGQQTEIATLQAALKEQAAQIQKISASLPLTEIAPRVVAERTSQPQPF
jgi:uncharacterized coiled-coil protein SlyX